MGQPLRAYVRNEALLELLEETRKAPAQMAVREIPLPPTRDRQPVYQGLASVLRSADGDISGIVTVLRDITGQKELERMKSNFLSVISHELKTPLHSIKGFVDIILMGKTGPINEVQRDFLSTVKDQTAQLQRLINDLLEFSRLESGQIKLQPEMMAVSSLVDEVMEKLRPLAEQGGLTLVNELPADFPAIEADPVRMEQVFSTLIDNAIKFTPAGGTITVAGEVIADGVRLYFKDTGIGIPLEERERIFDRFYQIEGGPTRPYRGTGLGLTICKHIVERHHGRIWVEGEPGQGAIFVVELPLRLPREEELSLDFSALPSSSAPERRDDAGAGR
jgi:signal transduction histidine kinase